MSESGFSNLMQSMFGIAKMPWVVRAYFALFTLFVVLIIFASWRVPSPSEQLTQQAIDALPISKLFNIAADGLKTVLGAVIGSLSLAGQKEFKGDHVGRNK